ncbi:hypothetical protein BH10PLA1_BH10PLA1_01240 [soil metagenome]
MLISRTYRTYLMLLTLFTTIGPSTAVAAEWQWSVADGNARVYLWIPLDCARIRGVVLANHNMIEQGIMEHPAMRKTLTELGFAEVWAVPMLEHRFDFHKGAGEHFQRVIDALAAESGYRELSMAPVVTLGHSASATWPWNFAAWDPGRTLCVLSVHGDAPQTNLTGYGGPNVDWGDRNIDGVPALMVMSEHEWWEDRLTPLFKFTAKHPGAPVSMLCDAGRGHFDFSDRLVDYLTMFIRKSAAARLPKTVGPLDAPVALRSVDPKDGWRMDRWRKEEPPTAAAAPYGQYSGEASQAVWCFDEEMAKATEAYYTTSRGKKPQLVAFTQADKVFAGEPAKPAFTAGEDGITFKVSAGFLNTVSGNGGNPANWAGAPNGSPIGHATGGGPVVLSRIVGPFAIVGPDTVRLQFDRAQSGQDGRRYDLWLLASHPGDTEYKPAVQQGQVRANPNLKGQVQTIDFPAIADQPASVKSVPLAAQSSAGLPVKYYVREGPAEIQGEQVVFTRIPPRSKFPLTVTVVGWQWGRSIEPKVQTATPVSRTFKLVVP